MTQTTTTTPPISFNLSNIKSISMTTMTTTILLIINIINIVNIVPINSAGTDDCIYNVSGNILNISALQGIQVTYETDGNFTYYYMPCADQLTCDASTGRTDKKDCMALQNNDNTDVCVAYLAVWSSDKDILPTYDGSKDTDEWTFKYTDGEASESCDNGRNLTITWKCDESETEFELTSASEDSDNSDNGSDGMCSYTYEIVSKYACKSSSNGGGGGGGGNSSGNGGNSGVLFGLSVGWIAIIIFGLVVVSYCCIGYVISAKYKNAENGGFKNVKGNIPHLGFWCQLLPKLVFAGCCVTKDCCVDGVQKMRGKGASTGYDAVED